MERLLDKISSPDDLKNIDLKLLPRLAKEIREFLVYNVSKTGGHLASNLGVVELTMALHYVFNTPKDKIVWDVGHQAYVHKILTGRKKGFKTLRKFGGLSGFPKPCESEYDSFATGHSSTSISAALGMACARDMKGDNNKVIAVIGDGSMTGGLAYEALNNAGRSNRDMIVVLNDNQMSISNNVGALSRHLNDIRTEPFYIGAKAGVHSILDKIPMVGSKIDKAIEVTKDKIKYLFVSGIMFEDLGFKYVGPVDGNNIFELVEVLNKVKNMNGPILLHIYTKKGKGYRLAEDNPCNFHGVSEFDIKTGKSINKSEGKSYSSIFGDKLIELAGKNKKIVAISAAMTDGTGLNKFVAKYPDRFFDVGIAEGHAVTFSAGLATEGFIPVFAVYSTFLQRAYDELIHDVCLENKHCIFAIDRAGIVGADGETHQGIFDISYLNHMPNMSILAPINGDELQKMLEFATNHNGPIAIRYPRGNDSCLYSKDLSDIEFGKGEVLNEGSDIAIFAVGDMMKEANEVLERLKAEGMNPMLINPRFIKPLDLELIKDVCGKCKTIFTIENNLKSGGFGQSILSAISEMGLNNNVHILGFDDVFVEHGSRQQLLEKHKLDTESFYSYIKSILNGTDE